MQATQPKRSNSKTQNKENLDSAATLSQWNVPDKHMIHLKANRIIGSGSFGKSNTPFNLFSSRLCL